MKKLFLYTMLIGYVGLFLNCEPVEDPGFNNPVDPDPDVNPEYHPPETIITEGPENGSVLNDHSVTFRWSGNKPEMEYQYVIDEFTSSWLSDTVITLTYLDEGAHIFQVKGRTEIEEESDPPQLNFSVDAVQGPALRYFPRKVNVTQNQIFNVEVYVEQVNDLAGIFLEIPITPDDMEYISHTIYTADTEFMGQNSGNVLIIEEQDENWLSISAARQSDTSPGVSGTGAFMTLEYRYTGDSGAELEFGSECELQNSQMQVLEINDTVKCIIVNLE